MERYCLVVRLDETSKHIAQKIKEKLDTFLIYDEDEPELVISVGGDGTMLQSVNRYGLKNSYFIGVHTGTLGFFTDYLKEEVEELVQEIKAGEYMIQEHNLLEVEVYYQDKVKTLYALNEMRLEKSFQTQVIEVYINDEFLETFRGDGLCVATSLGSTAYNKSVGGAVIYPGHPLMQLTEVAGLNNNAYRSLASPLVLDENQTINLHGQGFERVALAVDHLTYHFEEVKKISVRVSKQKVKFIQYRQRSFIQRIRRAFIQ